MIQKWQDNIYDIVVRTYVTDYGSHNVIQMFSVIKAYYCEAKLCNVMYVYTLLSETCMKLKLVYNY
jgi:hypothetical protein